MHPRPLLAAGALLLLLGTLLPALPSAAPQASGDEVLVVRIDDVVTGGTALHVEQAIKAAERRGSPLVLYLDTPGGRVDATLDIQRAVLNAEVPVLAYVGPTGGFAFSAGTFILLMGHPNGMAPGTQIGSARPVEMGPGGQQQEASDKVKNPLIEMMRDLAERSGRDMDLAETFITEDRTMNSTVALQTGMVDHVEPSLEAFVRAVHGQQALVGDVTVELDTQDARIVEVSPSLMVRTINIISNPMLAFVFFMAGMYALIFGLANPGSYVPETIGAVLLVLGLVGLGMFGVTTAGFILLLLGALFLVAELFTPTNGLLTALGVISLILAVMFLVDEPMLPLGMRRGFLALGYTAALLTGAAVFVAITVAMRTRKRRAVDYSIGDSGVAVTRLAPEGQVEVWGEVWAARSEAGRIEEGARVVVRRRDGMHLVVAPAPPEGSGDDAADTDPEGSDDDAAGTDPEGSGAAHRP